MPPHNIINVQYIPKGKTINHKTLLIINMKENNYQKNNVQNMLSYEKINAFLHFLNAFIRAAGTIPHVPS